MPLGVIAGIGAAALGATAATAVAIGTGVAGVASAARGSTAARRAGHLQAKTATTALQEEQRQFDITQEQFAPFREAGLSALQEQQALLGQGGAEEQQAAFAAFADTPGQQFLRAQQERALVRNASAIGGLGGGNVRTALQEQAFGRAQTDLGQQFNRLSALRTGGQTATQNVASFGAQSVGRAGQLIQDAGAARASGILGSAQARNQGVTQLAGLATQFFGGRAA